MRRDHKRNRRDARAALAALQRNPHVLRMKDYTQHGRVSTYEHCARVTEASCRLNRALHLNADETTLVRGAMLHDFYLYDWHHRDGTHRWHGLHHADRAADNAARLLGANERVCHVIRSHMWPLTLRRVPRSREAWIVCLADKWCSAAETLFHR
ncbi:MAG: HD domain-containing protein [Oscillospiraceae bacterium]|nr:HD domain-containing protein [Oscillospiraceae bacterium]